MIRKLLSAISLDPKRNDRLTAYSIQTSVSNQMNLSEEIQRCIAKGTPLI